MGWKILGKTLKHTAKVFSYYEVQIQDPKGREAEFDLLKCHNWINVLARSKSGEIVLVKQYRLGCDAQTIEFPAGTVEVDEDSLTAAKRELLEETGWYSDKWQHLGHTLPNPAFIDNRCDYYFADDCETDGETNFDEFEDIEIQTLTEQELEGLIRRGEMSHALTLNCYFLWKMKS